MSAAAPVLWSWKLSPFAGKVRLAFQEKGVALDVLEVHPVKRPARLKELNPLNRVPVLELADGTAIRESTVICEWLEETHPEPPLWPEDPALRGWARAWAKFIDDELSVSFFLGVRKQSFGKDEGDPDDIVEVLHARLKRRYGTLERALAVHDGPWLCGEAFTYADLFGTAVSVRVAQWRPDLLPDPETQGLTTAWLAALRERPGAAEAIDAEGRPAE